MDITNTCITLASFLASVGCGVKLLVKRDNSQYLWLIGTVACLLVFGSQIGAFS